MDGGNGTNSKSSYSVSNNQQTQSMNPKTFEETDNNTGSGNTNLSNTGSSLNNTNQPQQDFNLDDLNFDPAALIGGNGENTDLNVGFVPSFFIK